jgi:SAM-dependent methyltransferase
VSEFDPFARYYDADFAEHDEDVAFYRQMASRTGGPILELMCGTGRLLLPLVREGHSVTGVDVAPAMLARCRANLKREGLEERATLVEADVTQLALDTRFELALIAINSFMHLPDVEAQLVALQQTHAHLTPGALLILDLFNPDPRTLLADERVLLFVKSFELEDGRSVQKYLIQRRDFATQTSHVQFIYDELDDQGRVRREIIPFTMRWLYRYELEHLLARAGFRVEVIYGSYDLDPFESASPQLLVVASRLEA